MSFEEYKNDGNTYFQQGSYEAAIQYYEKCIQSEPKNPIGYSNKAMALIKLNRLKEAIESCEAGRVYIADMSDKVAQKLEYRLNLSKSMLDKSITFEKTSKINDAIVPITIHEVDKMPEEFLSL